MSSYFNTITIDHNGFSVVNGNALSVVNDYLKDNVQPHSSLANLLALDLKRVATRVDEVERAFSHKDV